MRLSLPSKGRLADDVIPFLTDCGLRIQKTTNPRQYQARIPALPQLVVLFQRPSDIVVSVRNGSIAFGITGTDVVKEFIDDNQDVLILHDSLGFGQCSLTLAIPEVWTDIHSVTDLIKRSHPIRVATKYPKLTGKFLDEYHIHHVLISAEGNLETAPAIGYADMISDLVSTGQTLRDNRLRPLNDGVILSSQATLIANRRVLQQEPLTLAIARQLLEFIEAHQRAADTMMVTANICGDNPEAIATKMFNQSVIGGLQGPTISRVYVHQEQVSWYAVNIVIKRQNLFQAINELRAIGGSGVIVTPITYIFEEEPPRYKAMLAALEI